MGLKLAGLQKYLQDAMIIITIMVIITIITTMITLSSS